MFKKLFLPLVFLFSASVSFAGTFDVGLNDSSVQLRTGIVLTEDDYGKTLFDARVLHNDHEETTLGSAGVDFAGEPGNVPGLLMGLGVKGYYGEADQDRKFSALGIGGLLNYYPPALGGFGLSGRLVYAPEISTAEDADRLFESSVALSYALTAKIRLTCEYQVVRVDWEKGSHWTVDEGFRLGFQAKF